MKMKKCNPSIFPLIIIICISLLMASCGGGGNSESASLTTWQIRNTPIRENLSAVIFGNGLFVAVGDNGTTIAISPDGMRWTENKFEDPVGSPISFYEPVYENDVFVAVGGPLFQFGIIGLYSSSDGINWKRASSTGGFLINYEMTYANGMFWALKESISLHPIPPGLSVVTSIDGVTWVRMEELVTSDFVMPYPAKITYGNGLFVAVGRGGMIFNSPDMTKWTKRTSGIVEGLSDVTYGAGIFVAIGSKGRILDSPDGKHWTVWLDTQGFEQNLFGVCYGNGTFVIVGADGIILQSDTL
jgi:hypothetical protein